MILSSLMLAAALSSGDAPTIAGSPKDWAPMYPYVGTWSGIRGAAKGGVAVTRQYVPSADSQQLEVIEQVGRHQSLWGVVSFDAEAHGLVLRRSGAAGDPPAGLFLKADSKDPTTLVFASQPVSGAPAAERITLERHGWSEFVERVEASTDGNQFTVVSETRFRRNP